MRLTNERNLPEAVVRAVSTDSYILVGDVSASALSDPVQKIVLLRRFDQQLQEDASKRIWMMLGRAAHRLLETSSTEGYAYQTLFQAIEEARLVVPKDQDPVAMTEVLTQKLAKIHTAYTAIPLTETRLVALATGTSITPLPLEEAKELTGQPHEGIILSGQFDHYDRSRQHLDDYKVTNVASFIIGSREAEWRVQESMYALLLDLHEMPVKTAAIIAILRDWMESQVGRKHDYPERPIFNLPIELLPFDEIFSLATTKAQAIIDAMSLPIEQLPPCTDEERWYRPPSFAVFRKATNQRATKVFRVQRGGDVEQARVEATSLAATYGPNAKVEERKAVYPRCSTYCSASTICHQWACTQKEEGISATAEEGDSDA